MIRKSGILKRFLGTFLICLSFATNGIGQHLTSPAELSVPATTYGNFYNETSITLLPGFSATPSGSDSYSYYIAKYYPPSSINFTNSQNYVLTLAPRVSGILKNSALANRNIGELMQTIQYLDAIGRPIQSIQINGSPKGRDIVQPMAYDLFGRQTQVFLPYTSTLTVSDGRYKSTALIDQAGFYNNPTDVAWDAPGIVTIPSTGGITPSFSQTVFEQSPLDRKMEQGAPGKDWQPYNSNIINSGHTLRTEYLSNNVSLFTDTAGTRNVVKYSISAINASTQARTLSIAPTGKYDAGQLYVTKTADENWKTGNGRGGTTEEYKNKDGQVILQRAYNWIPGSPGTLQILSTYYVYDDLGNLAYVLPPIANPDGGITSANDQNTLDNICYQYRYDERNRLTQKKLPGKGWEFKVYNKLDQLVATQDANQRGKTTPEWTCNRYDAQGRVVVTGIYQYGGTGLDVRDAVQMQANNQTTLWERPTGAVANYGYTALSFPSTLNTILTVNYYDDYSFAGSNPYPSLAGSSMTKGLLTGSQTNILGTGNLLWTVTYYDDEGRTTRIFKQHYLGGGTPSVYNYDEIVTFYNFNDQPTNTTRRHYTKNAGNTAPVLAVTIDNSYDYDHSGRKTNTWQQMTNGVLTADAKVLLANLEYNEIGQVWKKHLHSTDGVTFTQDVITSYNERGWITKINDPNSVNAAQVFGQQLQYNNGTTPRYNGSISGIIWQIMVPAGLGLYQQKQSYDYQYDQLNRLSLAGYTTLGAVNKFNEQLSYDLLGNITNLKRTNTTVANQYLNNLTYDYSSGGAGSRLWAVSDAGTAAQSSIYSYDPNGNVIKDTRNQITNINYNILNLPSLISRTPGDITYVYNASGDKLQKVSAGSTRDYISGIEYNNNAVEFVATEEGRAILSGNAFIYHYYLKDHLGNTRAIVKQGGGILQVQDYYAFGMEMATGNSFASSPPQQYKYNGKELQAETGNYDYGARFYDPVIGRWTNLDPSSENYANLSPFNYGANNPLSNIDIDGRDIINQLQGNFRIQYDKLVSGLRLESSIFNRIYTSFEKSSRHYYIFDGGMESAAAQWHAQPTTNYSWGLSKNFPYIAQAKPDYNGQIFVNKSISAIESASIYEEVFHGYQTQIYGIDKVGNVKANLIQIETEARVARFFDKQYSTGDQEYYSSFINNKDVIGYYDGLRSGDKKGMATHLKGFRDAIMQLANLVSELYIKLAENPSTQQVYEKDRTTYKNGVTPAFDKLFK